MSKVESSPSAWHQARMSVLGFAVVFIVSTAGFLAYVALLPKLEESEVDTLTSNFPPKSLDSLRQLRDVTVSYGSQYPVRVGVAMGMLYILMQSFSIPGTYSIALLSGALFGTPLGFIFTALVSTAGSSGSYMLSWMLGKPLALAVWSDKLSNFQGEVDKRHGDLFNYMLFLRLTPILPNAFISLASPIVGVPLPTFALATLLGCAPNNFMAVKAGAHLGEIQSMSELYDTRMVGLLALVGVIAILPVLLKYRSGAGKVKKE